jgi:hypothetical protein
MMGRQEASPWLRCCNAVEPGLKEDLKIENPPAVRRIKISCVIAIFIQMPNIGTLSFNTYFA